jgi:ABC-type glycerol-3-phosphate transport system substrate-binding protein
MISRTLWFTRLTLLLIYSLVLAACGGAPQTPAAQNTTAPDTTAATAAPAATSAPKASNGMRVLSGKITVAAANSLPVEGAEPTAGQTAWAKTLEAYKQLQPNVEVVLESVIAEEGAGEQWCQARLAGSDFPDLSLVPECDWGRPQPTDVAAGKLYATDFKAFEDEINPYTGKSWREDWISDYYRTGRCTEYGAYEVWTCIPDTVTVFAVWMNMDILKEYGYESMPKTYSELWTLSEKINSDGKYTAWDTPSYTSSWFSWIMYTNLAADQWVKAGGNIDDIQGSRATVGKNKLEAYCDGTFTASNNPNIQEALQQAKRYFDATNGGGKAFFDAARSTQGELWLSGKAAFRFDGSWFLSSMNQARADGTLAVPNWRTSSFPTLVKDDLINKELSIAFDGQPFMIAGGGGDNWAPNTTVRASGEDANVDLIVRDFLQFLSSPQGQELRIIGAGELPINPVAFEKLDAGLQSLISVKPPIFEKVTQPPGSWANELVSDESEQTIQAWWSGLIDEQTAFEKADENIRRQLVRNEIDQGREVPAACQPFAS